VNRDAPRKKEDFPLLNDQGILEIEATRYWESGVSVSSIRDIMEYICLFCECDILTRFYRKVLKIISKCIIFTIVRKEKYLNDSKMMMTGHYKYINL
jgi:hypothetical protein